EDTPLSPWWIRSILVVMVFGTTVLIAITVLGYKNAPPVPGKVIDAQGVTLKYGLMDNGSIWGHGAYLGPDYSAAALHRIGLDTADSLAQQQYGKPLAGLDAEQQAAVRAEVAVLLKTNRYYAVTDTLTLTPAESKAWSQEVAHWTDYFQHPATNGGLKPGLISDPTELREFTAFVTWAAWASVVDRPG